MAKYHEVGRFCDKKEEDIDWDAALFHEVHAADLGELEAILTLGKLYLGMERNVLINCTIDVRKQDTWAVVILAVDNLVVRSLLL